MKDYKYSFKDLRFVLVRHKTLKYKVRNLSSITTVVIHNSGVEGSVVGHANYHVNSRGWPGVGYHLHIDRSGVVSFLNDFTLVSYHCGNDNLKSIGICLEGDLAKKGLTDLQKDSLKKVIDYLMIKFNILLSNVKGHRECSGANTSCPGVSPASLRALVGSGSVVVLKPAVEVPVVVQKGLGLVIVKEQDLALRSGPGVSFKLIRRLDKGESYFAYSLKDGWYDLGGGQWASNVNNKYLEFKPHLKVVKEYIVKGGDTLWSLSEKYNLSVSDLKRLNNLKSDLLQIGQVLKLN